MNHASWHHSKVAAAAGWEVKEMWPIQKCHTFLKKKNDGCQMLSSDVVEHV